MMQLIPTPPPRLLVGLFWRVCGECPAFLHVAGEVHHYQGSPHTVNLEPSSFVTRSCFKILLGFLLSPPPFQGYLGAS